MLIDLNHPLLAPFILLQAEDSPDIFVHQPLELLHFYVL